jgi:hypothetical protein
MVYVGVHKHQQIGQYSRHPPVNVAESTEDSGPHLPAPKFRDVFEIVSVLAPAHQEEQPRSCACKEDMYRHQLELVLRVPDCDACSHFKPAQIRPHRRFLNAAVPQLSEQPLSLLSMLPLGKTDVEIAEGFW